MAGANMHIRHTNPPVGCGGPCGWVPRTAHVGFVSGALGIQISNPNWQPTANSGVGLVLVACFGWEPECRDFGFESTSDQVFKYAKPSRFFQITNGFGLVGWTVGSLNDGAVRFPEKVFFFARGFLFVVARLSPFLVVCCAAVRGGWCG